MDITERGLILREGDDPVGYERKTMKLPNGRVLPIVQAIEERISISSKFRLCHGTDSICSSQCPLVPSKQNEFRNKPCPLEVQQAHDLLYSLARELELKSFETTGEHLNIQHIVEEISQYSLISEYIKWEILSFRADMELAENVSVLYDKPTETKKGNIIMEKVSHPAITVAEMALKAKLNIQKEFMSTKKGRLERAQKETQISTSLAQLLETVRSRTEVDVIEAEFEE